MLQFHKKGKLIAILVGTSFALHFGNYLIKPLVIQKPEDKNSNNKLKKDVFNI